MKASLDKQGEGEERISGLQGKVGELSHSDSNQVKKDRKRTHQIHVTG